MQIVIDIPDNYCTLLEDIQNGSIASKIILNCVKNGTPLPKGHGRLIDADDFAKKFKSTINSKVNEKYVAPTIIEADKEVE